MNNLSKVWNGVVEALNNAKNDLEITGAERAASGKITSLPTPSVAVWIVPGTPKHTNQHGARLLHIEIFCYCIAESVLTEADATDNALDLALRVQNFLTDKEICKTIIEQPIDIASIEIVERSSSGAVAGVLMVAEIDLSADLDEEEE